jgi:hypothetical protein
MTKKIYISILAVMLIAGCKKAPLNVGPTNAYSSANYPSTIDQLQTVLVSAYANLRDPGLYGFWLLPKALSNSMHQINTQYGGDASWSEMANTNLSVGNTYVSAAWLALYVGVKDCNVTIAAAGQFASINPNLSAADKATVNLILGQAYCLRGWYYMELECLYGEKYMTAGGTNGNSLGVPIYNGLPTNLAETQVARSSVKDTWAFIINDFKQAQTLLKGNVWGSADLARVTQWTAEGLLGKAYVYTQDWADAKTVLADLMTNSGKTLMPYSTYFNAFNGQNKFNTESIFELYVDPNSSGYGTYSAGANSSTINGLIWSPYTYGGPAGGGFNGVSTQPLGYGNSLFHDRNVLRFGYSIGPAPSPVNNPNYDPLVGPQYYNQQQVMDPVYKQQALAVRTNKTADPRLFINALQPRLDSVQFDGVHWGLVAQTGYAQDVYGWAVKKYSPITYNEGTGLGNPSGIQQTADAWDYYILRLADVYLLYAEACIGTGDNVNGLEYINKVKRRAYNLPINTPSAIDYKSLTDKTSAINDPVLGNNPLYYERWAELFNEGSWWFDVCRWQIGSSEAAYYGYTDVPGPINFVPSKSYVWPIPQSEINSNSLIKQSSGY